MVLNVFGDVQRVSQLSDLIFTGNTHSFSNIAALPSNVQAVEASLMFAAGMSSFAVLVGPSGWGKTHLLNAAASHLNLQGHQNIEVRTVEDFLNNQSRIDSTKPLILDDAQIVLSRPRFRILLRLALERRVRSGRPTLIALTSVKPLRSMGAIIPNIRRWMVSEVQKPSKSENILLLNQLAKNEDVKLSSALSQLLSLKLNGNGRTFLGALRRLKLEADDWSERSSVLRACGILEPFFSDNSDWDLRHRILKEANRNRVKFPGLKPEELACYTMLREANLCEQSVAQYLNYEPSEVYLISSRFGRLASSDPSVGSQVSQFVECVIDSLSR